MAFTLSTHAAPPTAWLAGSCTICGIQGYELMLKTGYDGAAALIYEASCPARTSRHSRTCGRRPLRHVARYNADHLELLRKRSAADPLPAE